MLGVFLNTPIKFIRNSEYNTRSYFWVMEFQYCQGNYFAKQYTCKTLVSDSLVYINRMVKLTRFWTLLCITKKLRLIDKMKMSKQVVCISTIVIVALSTEAYYLQIGTHFPSWGIQIFPGTWNEPIADLSAVTGDIDLAILLFIPILFSLIWLWI